MEKESKKGGSSTLLQMVKFKFPSLNFDECKDYIKRAKVSNGGSLTGLRMGEIITMIKKLMQEESSKQKQNSSLVGKTCNLCFKKFSRNWACRRHIEKAHSTKETDDRTVKFKNNINRETESEVYHKCVTCEKQYKYPLHLERHLKKHEEKAVKHECKYCGKSFERLDTLLRHAQTLHKVYHKINFEAASSACIESMKCQICSLDFGDEKEKLYAHVASKVCHTKSNKVFLDKEDRYACTQCEKSYIDKDSLVKHIRWKHSSITPKFTCSLCNINFSYKSTLGRHRKKVHGSTNGN